MHQGVHLAAWRHADRAQKHSRLHPGCCCVAETLPYSGLNAAAWLAADADLLPLHRAHIYKLSREPSRICLCSSGGHVLCGCMQGLITSVHYFQYELRNSASVRRTYPQSQKWLHPRLSPRRRFQTTPDPSRPARPRKKRGRRNRPPAPSCKQHRVDASTCHFVCREAHDLMLAQQRDCRGSKHCASAVAPRLKPHRGKGLPVLMRAELSCLNAACGPMMTTPAQEKQLL